jgi:hypothetical protein
MFWSLMKSSLVFAALVGFALVNTAFLGAYLYSSANLFGGPSSGTSPVVSGTATSGVQTQAVTSAATSPTVASSTQASGSSATNSLSTVVSSASSGGDGYVVGSVSGPSSSSSAQTSPSFATVSSFSVPSVIRFFEGHSLALAPSSWIAVGCMWIWRGRMRSKWTDLGFDSDVFGLFVKMKGGKTRIRLLDALSLPKDRLQLAQELGLDWKGVDRHLVIMKKYGFVDDRVAYGKVRMYQLTPMGASLLRLLQELSREERRVDVVEPQPFQDHTLSN